MEPPSRLSPPLPRGRSAPNWPTHCTSSGSEDIATGNQYTVRGSIWKPEHEAWLRHEFSDDWKGAHSRAAWLRFVESFPTLRVSFSQYHQFARRIRDDGHVVVPQSPIPSLEEHVHHLDWRTFLVVSDFQCPYHDAELVQRSLDLARAWGVEGVVANGDVWDMASISKFSPSLHGERVSVSDELRLGQAILRAYAAVAPVLLIPGNHEWRLTLKLLGADLDDDQQRDLLAANERVMFTPLSFAICDAYPGEPIRISHPKAASVIAGTVGADIARNHDSHVIVAHDHLLAQRRSHNGRWSVTHTGMMASRERLGYAFTADNRRPLSNQGFAIVHPSPEGRPVIRLIDPMNCDWELEAWLPKRRRVA